MTIDEQIAILQAYKDGLTIEYMPNNQYDQKYYVVEENHLFDFLSRNYRILDPGNSLEEEIKNIC